MANDLLTPSGPKSSNFLSNLPIISKWLNTYTRTVVVDSPIPDNRLSRTAIFNKNRGISSFGLPLAPDINETALANSSDRNLLLSNVQLYSFASANISRRIRYHLYDLIEEWHPEVGAALDTIADEACIRGLNNQIFEIDIEKADGTEPTEIEQDDITSITQVLETFFFQKINISTRLWKIIRNLAKYGDWFVEPIFDKTGIVELNSIPDLQDVTAVDNGSNIPYYIYTPSMDQSSDLAANITRDYTSSLLWQPASPTNYMTSATPEKYIVFFDGELIHCRIDSKPEYAPYGTSHLDSLRQTWEILKRLEDAMMVYRMVRAPERKVFYIDTGNLPTNLAQNFLKLVQNTLKRKPSSSNLSFDSTSFKSINDVDKRYRFVAVDEDYWVPISANASNTKIETLSGATDYEIYDVEYFRDKFYTGLRIPKSYLNHENEVNRSTLIQQDVHFARLIMRYQSALAEMLEKLAIIQLYAWFTKMKSDNIDDFKRVKTYISKYKINFKWTTGSFIEENARYEGLKLRADIASTLLNIFGPTSKRYLVRNIFNMTTSEEELLLGPIEKEKEKEGEETIPEGTGSIGEFETPEMGGGEGFEEGEFGGERGESGGPPTEASGVPPMETSGGGAPEVEAPAITPEAPAEAGPLMESQYYPIRTSGSGIASFVARQNFVKIVDTKFTDFYNKKEFDSPAKVTLLKEAQKNIEAISKYLGPRRFTGFEFASTQEVETIEEDENGLLVNDENGAPVVPKFIKKAEAQTGILPFESKNTVLFEATIKEKPTDRIIHDKETLDEDEVVLTETEDLDKEPPTIT